MKTMKKKTGGKKEGKTTASAATTLVKRWDFFFFVLLFLKFISSQLRQQMIECKYCSALDAVESIYIFNTDKIRSTGDPVCFRCRDTNKITSEIIINLYYRAFVIAGIAKITRNRCWHPQMITQHRILRPIGCCTHQTSLARLNLSVSRRTRKKKITNHLKCVTRNGELEEMKPKNMSSNIFTFKIHIQMMNSFHFFFYVWCDWVVSWLAFSTFLQRCVMDVLSGFCSVHYFLSR